MIIIIILLSYLKYFMANSVMAERISDSWTEVGIELWSNGPLDGSTGLAPFMLFLLSSLRSRWR